MIRTFHPGDENSGTAGRRASGCAAIKLVED
jgi:hypothetical protein